jgi:hypothetical protein
MRLAEEIMLGAKARSAMSKKAELSAPCRPQLRDAILTKKSKLYRVCLLAPMSALGRFECDQKPSIALSMKRSSRLLTALASAYRL